MISKVKSAWKVLRCHYWGSLAFDVMLVVLAFLLLNAWQARGLPNAEYTPPLDLVWLDDMQADSVLESGKTGVVYFFAPWCFYCRKSIGNLDELVESKQLAWARVVALDYGALDEVREFISETGVNLPVLLGGSATMQDWQVRAFPTYFVIDGKGQIVSHSVGFSTKIGLQARLWMAAE